ncbi:sensor histidine kinase [Pseudolysinimonas sp.]|jgi:signal transduction histidine kinase|uniref:sensor histidine kinase n=1 Tax=Pseudolysinimonas sp. TaxID=2680009 RepID=UPI0037838BA3
MQYSRVMASPWWTVAVLAVVAVCGVILAFSWPTTPLGPVGAGTLVTVLIAFVTLGRRAPDGSSRAAVFVGILVVATFALVSVAPTLAVFQSLAMPAGWVLATTRRAGILSSAAVATAAAAGFFVSLGPSWATFASAGVTFVFSLTGSIALGLWIWRIAVFGAERARLLDELTAAQDELAVLHRDAGSTSERERLARDLHDTIAQDLAGVVLLVQRSRRELASGRLTDDTLELVEESARAALTETRTLVAGSAPVELTSGLPEALTVLVERFRRETSVVVELSVELDSPLDRDAEVVLLRCAQEGLANVRKHAGASTVSVSLVAEDDAAVLRVRDDGRGLDPAALPDGFGLSGLRARLALAGGTLTVASDGGTIVTATLPREVRA